MGRSQCAKAVLGLVFFLSGCHADRVTGTRQIPRPLLTYCAASGPECNALDGAIDQMEHSQDQTCRNLGVVARDRFNSNDYGFESNSGDPGAWGWVYPWPMAEPQYAPLAEYTYGVTFLSPATFNAGVELMRTVAHEEAHHSGNFDENDAEAIAQAC